MAYDVGSGKFWDLLGPEDQHALRSVAESSILPAGARLLGEGEKTNSVYVVLSGCMKIVSEGRGGHSSILALRGPGDVVGDMAAIDGNPHVATAVCVDRVHVYRVCGHDFRRLMSDRPTIAHAVLTVVIRRLRAAGRQRVRQADLPVSARLAILLLDMIGSGGEEVDGGTRLSLPVSQADLGAMVTASREAVTKVLSEWRRSRAISTGRGGIVVHRLDLLREIAEG